MAKNRNNKAEEAVLRLVSATEKDVLVELPLELASGEAEGEALMSLWTEFEADLSKLDEYGGGYSLRMAQAWRRAFQ
jgi:hypothetical protein